MKSYVKDQKEVISVFVTVYTSQEFIAITQCCTRAISLTLNNKWTA